MSASNDPASGDTPAASGTVVTRFAPSPTGFLHIGGARTALFNLLFARHHGGRFLLRIEDTDRARSTEPAIEAILDGMRWLGLDWDGATVFQSARAARHAEVARAMLAAGHAYRCYATPEELTALREAQRAAGQPIRYDGRWRDRTDHPEDLPYVVRLRAPREGAVTIDDLVQGPVTVQNAEIDDLVLLRSDGTPTYMLAVVVDDHDMGVTHVIRGDDHLNNAFRQLPIIRAMNDIEGAWPEPAYAHIPLIHGADGAKLSKRHGALGVDAYRDALGLLPEAVSNYLLRLGWGHGDAEIIGREQAIDWFDLAGVGRSPSRFDLKKLENLNAHYIREADDTRLAELTAARMQPLSLPVRPELVEGQPSHGASTGSARPETGAIAPTDSDGLTLLARAMPALKPRAANLNELAEGAVFLFAARPLTIAQDAATLLQGDAPGLLARVHHALDAAHHWDTETLEAAVRQVAEDAGEKLGQVAQPLRAALTGRRTSPGIFDVLVLLGRAESLARIADRMAA